MGTELNAGLRPDAVGREISWKVDTGKGPGQGHGRYCAGFECLLGVALVVFTAGQSGRDGVCSQCLLHILLHIDIRASTERDKRSKPRHSLTCVTYPFVVPMSVQRKG